MLWAESERASVSKDSGAGHPNRMSPTDETSELMRFAGTRFFLRKPPNVHRGDFSSPPGPWTLLSKIIVAYDGVMAMCQLLGEMNQLWGMRLNRRCFDWI